MPAARNLIGDRFGRLIVVAPARPRYWRCVCDCGAKVTVRSTALTTGNSKSCGCLRAEKMAETGKSYRTHGLSRTSEYRSWKALIHRCYTVKNNRYQYYGALGVTVCERWRHSFETFLADMGTRPTPTHSIDRVDPSGNYEPANCRWATPTQQRRNRRQKVKDNG